MFESRISVGATETLLGWQKPHAKTAAWFHDMEGLAKKCIEQYCEAEKGSSPFLDGHQFKQEELESVGDLSQVSSHNVLKCLCSARIGRPDILWSVNKVARTVTQWTQACDRRLAKLIPYIHHTNEFRQHCNVGNTTEQGDYSFQCMCTISNWQERQKPKKPTWIHFHERR